MFLTSIRIVWYKAWSELKAEAARAYLGIVWWVAEPILYMGTFYLIFSSGFRTAPQGFVAFLLCGLVPWKWFISTVQTGSSCIVTNKGLINQVYFPKAVLVSSIVVANSIKFVVVLLLLILFLASIDSLHLETVHFLFPTVAAQLILIFGLASLGSSIIPVIPDMKLVIDNAMLMLFFLSGIFFDVHDQPEKIQSILMLNPIAGILTCYRAALLGQVEFPWEFIRYAVVSGIILCAAGLFLLHVLDRKFAKIVI